MNIVYFLGRLHVVVLHLPIGIVLMAIAAEWAARRERFRALGELTPFLWWAAAVTAVVTAILGILHSQEGEGGTTVTLHRAFGISFAAAVVLACVLRQWRPGAYRVAHVPLSIVLIVLVTLTGHYGGNITHGSSFLVEYAPEPIRKLAGLDARREIITDPAKADAYLDVVQPVFDAHCTTCHNDSRKKGGLSLVSRERLMAGGRDGVVIVPGDASASELFKRITLPPNDEHAMPAEGKSKLSERDKRVVEWWIAAGAPANKRVAQMGPMPGTEGVASANASVASENASAASENKNAHSETASAASESTGAASRNTGASSGSLAPANAAASSAPSVPAASPESLAKLTALGFVIRPVAQGSPLLEVAFKGQGALQPHRANDFESLLLIKDQVVELNLRAAGLSDPQTQVIAQLPHLEHLRIELNDITDAGVRNLATLTQLRSLNLYGTKVTDASLETLMRMPSLRDVYLFQTAVTEVGMARVQAINRVAHGTLALHKS